MQYQVTTIATETINVVGANFQITTFEQKTSAFCDCCNNQAHGTKAELVSQGWGFGSGSEFCPECN